ncbi:hypothetical protein L3C95_15905 [Chitinophaga filiformis]|uniref:hypothetical protein n=1 Tax=Chitinophaga filiformis TaxID=104663 RepID=UPI001F44B106|nr:hypothetical protein [Chitinophaga filiformis]MCF6404382.1 hypothetical protein [Chitinophaga filiformis]
MKKRIYYLASLLLAAFLIVVILVYTSPSPNKQPNGFSRSYLQTTPLTPYMAIPTHDRILDIAGNDDSTFYFSTNDPAVMLSASMEAGCRIDTFHIALRQSLKDSMDSYFFTEVNKGEFFVYAYNIPAISKTGRTGSGMSGLYATFPAGGFSQAHVLRDGKHIMLRKLDIKEKDQFFTRVTLNGDNILTGSGLSAIRRDGGMSTDGSLNYDRISGLFTYLYYYSNRYVTFDSAMHLISEGTTIDTFTVSRFNISATMATKNVYMNQGPDQMVNGFSCVHNGVMYVQAKIKADNDDDRLFHEHCVIDQYDLHTNRYKGSIYLDIPVNARINQLFVYRDKLLVHCTDSVYAIKIAY